MRSFTFLSHGVFLTTVFVICSCSSSKSDTAATAPTVSSPVSIELYENALLGHQLEASGGKRIAFTLKNTADAPHFALSAEGNLTSRMTFDYENPSDSDANRIFDLTVIATNEHQLSSEHALSIRLLDVAEHALKVTYPTPNANIGGFQDTTVITGRLSLADGSAVTAGHGVKVFVNDSAAQFDEANPSRWRIEMPIAAGANSFDVHMGQGETLVSQSLVVNNDPLLDEIAVFEVGGAYSYGFAKGLNAALRVERDGMNAEILFTYPFSYNGETRCAEPKSLTLDYSKTRVVFMCEDREQGVRESRRSIMAFDYASGTFTELLSDSQILYWDQMAVVFSDNILLFDGFGRMQWHKIAAATSEVVRLEPIDKFGGWTDKSVLSSYVKVDGDQVYVFDTSNLPGVYRFDINYPHFYEGGMVGAERILFLDTLDLQLDWPAADSAVAYGNYLYYADNGVILAHDPDLGTTEVASRAFAAEDPNHYVHLQLNIRPYFPGLFVYDADARLSYELDFSSGAKSRLAGPAVGVETELPYVSQLSLDPSTDALMVFSRERQQLHRVDLSDGSVELKRTYSLPGETLGVYTAFAYHWEDSHAFFAPFVDWGGSTETGAVHAFSIATDTGERTNLVDGAQLADHLGLAEGSLRLRSNDISIDEQSDRLLLSAWGTEGVDGYYQALYWFDITSQSVELANMSSGPDRLYNDAYYLGSVDSATRRVAMSRWALGDVAMLDIDTNEITTIYPGPVPYVHTTSPAIDSRRNRVTARSFEGDAQGAIWGTETAVAFDIATGDATPLFPQQAGSRFSLDVADITVDGENDRAFMISNGLLIVVDLETGARAVVTQ